MKLSNKVALVTGGGTGMGRAMSELFARQGAHVVVNYSQSRADAESTVNSIRAQGGSAIAFQASVAVEAEVVAMIAAIDSQFHRLDILVNNAGWSQRVPHADLAALTDEIWDRTLNTNLRGAFYCVRSAEPLLRRHPGASIINIASVAGISGMGSSIVYAASKAAMIAMNKSLARALAPAIRVNAICPGFVRTRFANWPDAAFDEGEAQTPLERLATVDDVAETALFLAAGPASLTGEEVILDGGTTQLGPRARKHV